jgi:hypothetical protein
MEGMSGMRRVREGVEEVKVKLKGTSRPQDKNPIGEYISNRSNRDFFYRNFLRGFSTPIFYENFPCGFSTATFLTQNFNQVSFLNIFSFNKPPLSLRVKQVLTK